MKRRIVSIIAITLGLFTFVSCSKTTNTETSTETATETESVVYMTSEISPESLVKIYEKLGVKAEGKVGVKISTGEGKGVNALSPELIAKLVKQLNANIVECNTAYDGTRNTTAKHRQTTKQHGYDQIATVDILDEEGEVKLPIANGKHLKYDIVGSHINNYDFIVNLAHFKGHQMAGFGGVLKNQSIGFASSAGKVYIHTAGKTTDQKVFWDSLATQDDFTECMAEAAKAVADKFKGKIVYIAVMNNMSIDCDCNANPKTPTIKDYGILASTDPVALDKACVDIIYNMEVTEENNTKPLIERIEKQKGTHIIDHAEAIGLGTTKYKIVKID